MPGRDPDDHVGPEQESEDDLKVMLVANLLLFGSEAGFVNLYFRDYYMSKFFKVSGFFLGLLLNVSSNARKLIVMKDERKIICCIDFFFFLSLSDFLND